MEQSRRKKAGLCCAAIAAIALLAALTIAAVVKYVVWPNVPQFGPPPSLEAEGPTVGADRFERSAVFEDERIGPISAIAIGDYDPSPGAEIVVAGLDGAAFLDEQLQTVFFVTFERPEDHPYGRTVEVVDVEGDGICEFLVRGSYGGLNHGALLDHKGHVLWRTAEDTGIHARMAAGDIDADGLLEFATVQENGLTLLDSDGSVLWAKQLEGPGADTVQMADVTGDGVPEILWGSVEYEDDRKVELIGCDAEGETVHVARRKGDLLTARLFITFSVCPWPTVKSPAHFLAPVIQHVVLFDGDGRTVLRARAPGTNPFDLAVGTPIRLEAGADPCLASIVVSLKFEASFLRIHDAAGRLLYEEATELFGDPDVLWVGMAPWQPAGEDAEVLLVGGLNKVWQYRLKPGEE